MKDSSSGRLRVLLCGILSISFGVVQSDDCLSGGNSDYCDETARTSIPCGEGPDYCGSEGRATLKFPNTLSNIPRYLVEGEPPFRNVETSPVDTGNDLIVETTSTSDAPDTLVQLSLLNTGGTGTTTGLTVRTAMKHNGAQQWYSTLNKVTADGPFLNLLSQAGDQPDHICCAKDNRILRMNAQVSGTTTFANIYSSDLDKTLVRDEHGTVVWSSGQSEHTSWLFRPEISLVKESVQTIEVKSAGDDDRIKRSVDSTSQFLSFGDGFLGNFSAGDCASPGAIKDTLVKAARLTLTIFEYNVSSIQSENNAVLIRNDATNQFLAVDTNRDFNIRPKSGNGTGTRMSNLLQVDGSVFGASSRSLGQGLGYFQNSDPRSIRSPDQRFFTKTPLGEAEEQHLLCSFHHRQNCLVLANEGLIIVSIPSSGESPLKPTFRDRTPVELQVANARLTEEGVGSLAAFFGLPLDIHCSSNPCRNGGQCMEAGDTYACTCPEGYQRGQQCDQERPERASKEFVFAFMEITTSTSLTIYCASASNSIASVTLTSPAATVLEYTYATQVTKVIPPGEIRNFTVVSDFRLQPGTHAIGIQPSGLRIVSDEFIICYHENENQYLGDSAFLIPREEGRRVYSGDCYGNSTEERDFQIVTGEKFSVCSLRVKVQDGEYGNSSLPFSIPPFHAQTSKGLPTSFLSCGRITCNTSVYFYLGKATGRSECEDVAVFGSSGVWWQNILGVLKGQFKTILGMSQR